MPSSATRPTTILAVLHSVLVPTDIQTFRRVARVLCLVVGLFAELESWIANASSPIEVTYSAGHSPTQPCTDDVTSIGDETFAIQLSSSTNRPITNCVNVSRNSLWKT
ncbi:hypothetical protein T265_14796, partial [Opisthorchis viverrini]